MEGFAGASAMMSGLRQQYAGLRTAVESGGFRVEPQAATDAAKACRDFKDQLDIVMRQAWRLARVNGLGESNIGRDLAQKFVKKADGTPDSLVPIVRQAQDILENMAQTYEAAGRSYQQTDEANRQAFGGRA
ncbi:hypothetical protein GCM10012275_00180 [Longimycelium tulufanense]|uniref:Uncharacterized protein n=1 Tax=Longimycelium tulufanense TaxID=907463 RepID=A0A8J3C9M4_9PSEU|nr:hypothetical protein [Longimycelium tulufanense]GGM32746.1 hypothetical protein GCM10012275_00180 [Longimycelium tulufanense]